MRQGWITWVVDGTKSRDILVLSCQDPTMQDVIQLPAPIDLIIERTLRFGTVANCSVLEATAIQGEEPCDDDR